MSLTGQPPPTGRHLVVPRTLSFLFRDDKVLLLRLADGKGVWSGRLNGIGGHVEAGEAPLASAVREIKEETGLVDVDSLRLCGVVHVDTGDQIGVLLMVFGGIAGSGSPAPGLEGQPVWVEMNRLGTLPVIEDLPQLIPLTLRAHQTGTPFSARSHYDGNGRLIFQVEEQGFQ